MKPDVSVQSLLDKIKKEGIEEANKAAEEILEEARSKAGAIMKKAQEQAESVVREAKAEIQKNREAFERSMSQAARNLVLGLETDITRLCDHIVERRTASALTPEVMKEMILKIVAAWQAEEAEQGLEVLTSEKDRQRLEELLYDSLKNEFGKGVTLKPIDKIHAGFRIGEKEGHLYYDFTHKGIAEILMEYLNPRIAKYLEDI